MDAVVENPEVETEEEPGNLATAILEVIGRVKRLEKGDKNEHGKYDFTSVDDYKDFIRPLLVDAGLVPHINQVNFQMISYMGTDKTGKPQEKSLAQFDFAVWLEYAPRREAEIPDTATVALPMTGAQTFGAAKSYALKEWLKGRFLLSSGDSQDEADLLDQAKEGLRLSKGDARELNKALDKEFKDTVEKRDHEALAEWWQENKYRIETLPKDWYLHIRTEYAGEYKRLKAEAALDGMTNADLDQRAMDDEIAQHPISSG